jgi:hypothetical protein
MFGGATISLILPKLIRSVARDGIYNFLFGRQPAVRFLSQRHEASCRFQRPPAKTKTDFLL